MLYLLLFEVVFLYIIVLQQIAKLNPAQLRQHLSQTYKNLEAHKFRLKDQNDSCLTSERI